MSFKVIIDFDGTLTAEEEQVGPLAELALRTLADEILGVPYSQLQADYAAAQRHLLRTPHRYGWWVNGLLASYCDEGPFILNTATLMHLLTQTNDYLEAVRAAFPDSAFDPVSACTNHLFHRHTAELAPLFRPAAQPVLEALMAHPERQPLILTNSRGDKVRRLLASLGMDGELQVLGDTRQYAMAPDWEARLPHPVLGDIQVWPVDENHPVDLRRPAYFTALWHAASQHAASQHTTVDGNRLAVVADTFSLPGALPLLMGIPFLLLRNSYTPTWCLQAVSAHPLGQVLDDLADLPAMLDDLEHTYGGDLSNR